MSWFRKKEIEIKSPVNAYKFTRGGLYIIEYNDAVVTRAQIDEIERYASVYDITIKFIRSHGNVVGLYPVTASQCKCSSEGATHE